MAKGKAQKLEKRKAREGEVPGRLDPLMEVFESKIDKQLTKLGLLSADMNEIGKMLDAKWPKRPRQQSAWLHRRGAAASFLFKAHRERLTRNPWIGWSANDPSVFGQGEDFMTHYASAFQDINILHRGDER